VRGGGDMKVRVKRLDIKEAVRKVAGCADKKGNIPILSNILIEAEDNTMRLTATNLEMGASTVIPSTVDEPGKTTVNAVKFSKFVASFSGEEFEMRTEDSKLTITSTNLEFSLATLPPEEFPEIELPEEYSLRLLSSHLEKGIKKVSYAVSKDEARYILTGVYLNARGDKFHVVATDGHRLALYELPSTSEEFSAIVPRKFLTEFRKVLKESADVELLLKDNKFFARAGDTVVWTSVIEGEYPDYLAVIPESNPLKCVVERDEFLSALKEIAVIYEKEEVKAVILNLTPGKLELNARGGEIEGTAEEGTVSIPAEYSGEEFQIGFNINHLIESISSFDGDTIKILMDKPITPVLIASDEEPELKNVIMPMKVQ
jgi:DNA polymerase-3 subunit beta